MITPPATGLSAWRPNHWITETGYALNEKDLKLGSQRDPECRSHASHMLKAAKTTTDVLQEVMAK